MVVLVRDTLQISTKIEQSGFIAPTKPVQMHCVMTTKLMHE
jgi:hypothetical protein